MELLSERYGWTPNEIRAISVEDIYQYIEIINEKQNLEKIRMMKSRQH